MGHYMRVQSETVLGQFLQRIPILPFGALGHASFQLVTTRHPSLGRLHRPSRMTPRISLTGDVEVATKADIEECCGLHGFTLLALETDINHDHCFVSAPPKDSPAKIVGLLKGHSSRRILGKFPALAKRTGKDQLWTSARYAGTAGQVSAETIRRYITDSQGK